MNGKYIRITIDITGAPSAPTLHINRDLNYGFTPGEPGVLIRIQDQGTLISETLLASGGMFAVPLYSYINAYSSLVMRHDSALLAQEEEFLEIIKEFQVQQEILEERIGDLEE